MSENIEQYFEEHFGEIEITISNIMKLDESLSGLKHALVCIPKHHAMLNRLLFEETSTLKKLLQRQDSIKHERWEYYNHRAPSSVYAKEPLNLTVNKTDSMRYVNADKKVQEINLMVDHQEEIVKYIESSLKRLGQRGYEIRCWFEMDKLTAGDYSARTIQNQ